jgi:transmembrane sensor
MIERVIDFPDRARLMEEAAAWVAKLDGGELTAGDLRTLRAWSQQSPHHHAALDEMAERWDNLDVLAVYRDRLDAPAHSFMRSSWLSAALAAGLAMLAVALWFTVGPAAIDITTQNAIYVTAVGEQQDITLPDGTTLRINTNSRLRVAYTKARRTVRLYHGEVFFEVVKSADWPFEVDTGNVTVTAVGTAFAVRIEANNAVEVNVTEGRVRVSTHTTLADDDSPGAESNAYTAELNARQQVRFDQVIGSVQTLEPAQLERELSWRDGMLIFDRQPLEQVVAEVSRYTPVKIVITDPVLRRLEFGGYFPTGDTEALLNTLEGDFGIRVDRVQPGLIYLRAALR